MEQPGYKLFFANRGGFMLKVWLVAGLLILHVFTISFFACDQDDDNDDDSTGDDDDDDNNDNDDNDDDNSIDDGVWNDEATNLIWQIESNTREMNWFDALEYCESLSQGDENDWRLPTISELRTLIQGCPATVTDGECGVTDECLFPGEECRNNACWGCITNKGPAGGCYWPSELKGNCFVYWSSSYSTGISHAKWAVRFEKGGIVVDYSFDGQWNTYPKNHVRCVRTKIN